VTKDVLNEPATKADLKELEQRLEQRLEDKLASKADLKELEQRFDEKLQNYPTKSDLKDALEGWAERIISVVRDEFGRALSGEFDRRIPQLKRELREELGADIRGAEERVRVDMRAHVEELKATHVPRTEFAAHRDDTVLHRQPRRRRS
jgi:hypothetical protein